jgi:hypothetical protein
VQGCLKIQKSVDFFIFSANIGRKKRAFFISQVEQENGNLGDRGISTKGLAVPNKAFVNMQIRS